jgi:hypothetical protein
MGKGFQAMVIILESIVFLVKAISHAIDPKERLPDDRFCELRFAGKGDNNA